MHSYTHMHSHLPVAIFGSTLGPPRTSQYLLRTSQDLPGTSWPASMERCNLCGAMLWHTGRCSNRQCQASRWACKRAWPVGAADLQDLEEKSVKGQAGPAASTFDFDANSAKTIFVPVFVEEEPAKGPTSPAGPSTAEGTDVEPAKGPAGHAGPSTTEEDDGSRRKSRRKEQRDKPTEGHAKGPAGPASQRR